MIAHARKFIATAMHDEHLRDKLVFAATATARTKLLAQEGWQFSLEEFDEACRNELTKCQAQAEVEQLQEFNQWWQLLARMP